MSEPRWKRRKDAKNLPKGGCGVASIKNYSLTVPPVDEKHKEQMAELKQAQQENDIKAALAERRSSKEHTRARFPVRRREKDDKGGT